MITEHHFIEEGFGSIVWLGGSQFVVCDEFGTEVDVFNVCDAEGLTLEEASEIAEGVINDSYSK